MQDVLKNTYENHYLLYFYQDKLFSIDHIHDSLRHFSKTTFEKFLPKDALFIIFVQKLIL